MYEKKRKKEKKEKEKKKKESMNFLYFPAISPSKG
jgi:hypothetical protein